MKFVDVILPLGFEGLLTYSVPQDMEMEVMPFIRVKVPLGITKTYTALITKVHEEKPSNINIKDIISIIDTNAVLIPQQYELWKWISEYYMSPIGDVLRAALPLGMKTTGAYRPKTDTYIRLNDACQSEEALHHAIDSLQRAPMQQQVFTAYLAISHWDEGNRSNVCEITREALMNETHCSLNIINALCARGLLRLYDKEVGRLNCTMKPHPENIKTLNPYQQQAFKEIHEQWNSYNTCLLHGVTSSGKTEIYISLIQEAIDEGKQVLYLLPEIALTVQITQRLQRVFGNRIGIYHSKYSDAERVEIWQKQLSSTPYDIILGARSAVFLPYQRLGLVIVDEEHETSYKQQDPAPRYHGRSVAIVLAHMYGAKTLLGTATPSAETYFNAQPPSNQKDSQKYGYVKLTHRHQDLQLPQIETINVRDLRHRKIMRGPLSPQLNIAISNALKAGEQVILFQNRRGFSPIVECHECGWVPRCPHCDVSLTYHKNTNSLSCHYCGHTLRMPSECPECHNRELKDRGFGTEKIEDIIQEEFPNARISRMDLDTTRTRNGYERIISDFSSHKTDILIGTQMVTKGLDFDHVSVVGILSADTMLNQPDFRAWEHTFTMATQVAGRAGRKGRQGLVIMQTRDPELPVVQQIVRNDFLSFFHNLMEERWLFKYPPFTRLTYIYLRHKDNNIVETAGIELANRLRNTIDNNTKYVILGPDKPAVSRIKTLFIRKIMVKIPSSSNLSYIRNLMKHTVKQMLQHPNYKSLQIYFDVDPV